MADSFAHYRDLKPGIDDRKTGQYYPTEPAFAPEALKRRASRFNM
jgi:hypothetical protein